MTRAVLNSTAVITVRALFRAHRPSRTDISTIPDKSAKRSRLPFLDSRQRISRKTGGFRQFRPFIRGVNIAWNNLAKQILLKSHASRTLCRTRCSLLSSARPFFGIDTLHFLSTRWPRLDAPFRAACIDWVRPRRTKPKTPNRQSHRNGTRVKEHRKTRISAA